MANLLADRVALASHFCSFNALFKDSLSHDQITLAEFSEKRYTLGKLPTNFINMLTKRSGTINVQTQQSSTRNIAH